MSQYRCRQCRLGRRCRRNPLEQGSGGKVDIALICLGERDVYADAGAVLCKSRVDRVLHNRERIVF